jgi:ferric-dicitrate binding protein FerR (iron transport regulator)
MDNRLPLTDRERADLVAYLDGELPPEQSRAMEARLSQSPEARAEAESLKRTWDLLDFLPRAAPSPSFTEQTLSRLTPVHRGGVPWRRGLVAAWAAGVLIAFATGWVGYNRLAPRRTDGRDLVRDLRLIENKRLYDVGEDLDFLRALDHPDLFGEERPGS